MKNKFSGCHVDVGALSSFICLYLENCGKAGMICKLLEQKLDRTQCDLKAFSRFFVNLLVERIEVLLGF